MQSLKSAVFRASSSATAMLTLCAILLAAVAERSGGGAWIAILSLDRQALMQGEIWRLWTGHLVHFSAQHALVNCVVFAITGSIVEIHLGRKKFALALIIGAALTSLALMAWQTNLMEYRGLSAIGAALTVAGLFIVATQSRAAAIYVAVFGFFLSAKLLGEVFGLTSAAANLPADVAVEWRAHVLGFVAGCVLILVMLMRHRRLPKKLKLRLSPAHWAI